MTTDLASTNYQFRRLKDMLIADGDADEEEENFDGQKIKWKAYTLLRKQFKRIEKQKWRADKAVKKNVVPSDDFYDKGNYKEMSYHRRHFNFKRMRMRIKMRSKKLYRGETLNL